MDWSTIGMAIGGSVTGSFAVLKAVPYFTHKNGNGNGTSPSRTISDAVTSSINSQLAPLLRKQTEILERMDERQEKLSDILRDNTTALQVFMKLEEQRDRLERG